MIIARKITASYAASSLFSFGQLGQTFTSCRVCLCTTKRGQTTRKTTWQRKASRTDSISTGFKPADLGTVAGVRPRLLVLCVLRCDVRDMRCHSLFAIVSHTEQHLGLVGHYYQQKSLDFTAHFQECDKVQHNNFRLHAMQTTRLEQSYANNPFGTELCEQAVWNRVGQHRVKRSPPRNSTRHFGDCSAGSERATCPPSTEAASRTCAGWTGP